MQESYIIWQGKSSKDLGLICENVKVSQPEQKNKILQTPSTDNNYIYTSLNSKNRPFFENRIITVSSYFKYSTLEDKTAKLSEIMNWLYSYKYGSENEIKVLPDYSNVIWEDCKIENIQQIEKVSAHTINIIFQFRVNAFSSAINSQSSSVEIDFTEGKHALYFINKGFFTQDFKIILTGGCNYFSIENVLKQIMIDVPGFRNQAIIDFKNEVVVIDGEEQKFNIDYYELSPGENYFAIESDSNNMEVEFDVVNKYLYSYEKGTKNEIQTEILID